MRDNRRKEGRDKFELWDGSDSGWVRVLRGFEFFRVDDKKMCVSSFLGKLNKFSITMSNTFHIFNTNQFLISDVRITKIFITV